MAAGSGRKINDSPLADNNEDEEKKKPVLPTVDVGL